MKRGSNFPSRIRLHDLLGINDIQHQCEISMLLMQKGASPGEQQRLRYRGWEGCGLSCPFHPASVIPFNSSGLAPEETAVLTYLLLSPRKGGRSTIQIPLGTQLSPQALRISPFYPEERMVPPGAPLLRYCCIYMRQGAWFSLLPLILQGAF